jgi:hypothetical protein
VKAAGRTTGVRVGLWLIAAAFFTWTASSTWDSVVDDAYITARYAAQLAAGNGVVFNAGEPPVEGVTNLAWTFWLAIGERLHLDMLDWMIRSGWLHALACLALMIPVTDALSRPAAPAAGPPAAPATSALPAILLALFPHFGVVATNGLETTQWVASVLLTVWAWLELEGRRRWLAGAAAAAMIWVRPEAMAVAGVLTAFDALRRRHDRPALLAFAAPWIVSLLALLAWRYSTYGLLLPNTWYAKTSFPITETFTVNAAYFTPEVWVTGSLLLTFLAAAAWMVRDLRMAGVAAVIALLIYVPLNVYEWMPGLRLFQPSIALTLCLVGAAVNRLPRARVGPASAALIVAMTALAWESGERARAYDSRHTVERRNGAATAAYHVGKAMKPGAWVATRDAGVFAYFVGTHVNVAELHHRALTQPHPDGRDAIVTAYTPRNPEIFVATVRTPEQPAFEYGNDRKVWERMSEPYTYLGRVNQHYRRHYDVYVRADAGVDPLPDGVVVSTAGPQPGSAGAPPAAPGAADAPPTTPGAAPEATAPPDDGGVDPDADP